MRAGRIEETLAPLAAGALVIGTANRSEEARRVSVAKEKKLITRTCMKSMLSIQPFTKLLLFSGLPHIFSPEFVNCRERSPTMIIVGKSILFK